MKRKKEIGKLLDGMYEFMAKAYEGNWRLRSKGTPYMAKAEKGRKLESVLGHMWACVNFWYYLRRVCPALNTAVDSIEVFEILLIHDLGDTQRDEVPLYRVVSGEDRGKVAEREAIKKMSRVFPLSSNISKDLVERFAEYDKDINKIDKLEFLVAKFIDHIQGNHYILTFGNDFSKYKEPIDKVLRMRLGPYAKRLMDALKERKEEEAFDEVQQVVKHHVEMIKASGIDVDLGEFGL